MDYLKKIEEIIALLTNNNYSDEAEQIAMLRDDASISSELLMSVVHELLRLINTNDDLKNLIGESVFELKNFCWSIGLIVR